MVINAFLSGFLVLPVKKSDMSVKNKRQLNLTHHKQEAQEIQSLENFVSMAIQGTQVPMDTKHSFCIFLIFQFFFYFYIKKNKLKLKNKQTKTC